DGIHTAYSLAIARRSSPTGGCQVRIGVKIGVGVAVLGLVLSTTQAAGAAPPPEPASAAGSAKTVTLLTGDQVTVHQDKARSVRPGQGRAGMAFSTFSAKGHDYVIPADAR